MTGVRRGYSKCSKSYWIPDLKLSKHFDSSKNSQYRFCVLNFSYCHYFFKFRKLSFFPFHNITLYKVLGM